MKKLLLLFAVLMTAVTASAENYILYTSSDGEVVWPYNDDYADYDTFGANIISNTYRNGHGKILFDGEVTSIGYGAFRECSRLTSVEIPNSVTTIGYGAFSGCSSLESFTGKFASEDHRCLIVDGVLNSFAPAGLTSYVIPNSVTSIGEGAFSFCSNLTSVEIPNSVIRIGWYAFQECRSLISVVIGNSVRSIGFMAVAFCSSLTSIEIPNSVTSIDNDAFLGCSSLTSLEIPNSVTTIGSNPFRGCSRLESFTGKFASEDHRCLIVDGVLNSFAPAGLTSYEIPNSVTSIGSSAFSGCSSLTSIEIPNSVTTIEWGAFECCFALTSVVIPNSVTTIEWDAFYYCSGLTSVEIPNSVTTIGSSAFSGCSSLTSVEIPNSVTTIGDHAFFYCSSLKEIISLNTTPPSVDSSTFNSVNKATCVLKVQKEAMEAYKMAEGWKEFKNIVEISHCGAPTLAIEDGKLVASSTTKGATCHTSITCEDSKDVDSNEPIELTGIYTITSYAHAEGYQNSETVTATLVWLLADDVETGVLSMDAKKAVLIRAAGGNVIVSGTEQGETILLYTIDGKLLSTVIANDGETAIPCSVAAGEVVIVKYGNKAVKVQL